MTQFSVFEMRSEQMNDVLQIRKPKVTEFSHIEYLENYTKQNDMYWGLSNTDYMKHHYTHTPFLSHGTVSVVNL